MVSEPSWLGQLEDAGCSLGAVMTGGPWLQPLDRGSCRTLVAGGRWLQPRGLWPERAWVVKVVERFMWRAAVCEAGRAGLLVSFLFVVSG